MTRQDKFLPSAALYAVDLSALTRVQVGTQEKTGLAIYRYTIPAVWFRRRKGIDTANIGYLWDITTRCHDLGDTQCSIMFLETTLTDGRYGPTCRTRFSFDSVWSDPLISYDQALADVKFLNKMLRNYPNIPKGYNGWWKF